MRILLLLSILISVGSFAQQRELVCESLAPFGLGDAANIWSSYKVCKALDVALHPEETRYKYGMGLSDLEEPLSETMAIAHNNEDCSELDSDEQSRYCVGISAALNGKSCSKLDSIKGKLDALEVCNAVTAAIKGKNCYYQTNDPGLSERELCVGYQRILKLDDDSSNQ